MRDVRVKAKVLMLMLVVSLQTWIPATALEWFSLLILTSLKSIRPFVGSSTVCK